MIDLIAIDPGTTHSAVYDARGMDDPLCFILDNNEVLGMLQRIAPRGTQLAIEMIASYGMPVGKEVFETCVWIGRYIEAWGGDFHYVYRKDVKLHLCGQTRGVNDTVIRQALIDRYGPGKDKAIGKKASPGPLYGYKKDMWAALAVAVTFSDKQEGRR